MRIKEKLLEYKNYIVVIVIILALLSFNIYTLTLIQYDESDTEEVAIADNKEQETKKIKVDVKGEINAAGVYELNEGSRIADLIKQAGGVTKNADTSITNLSKLLQDEMVVIIYSKNEVKKLKENKNEEIVCPKENIACPEKDDTIILENNNDNNQTENGKISINKASVADLTSLPSIGESKAKQIVKYREENGEFKTIEDIKNVTGIGDQLFEKIKDYISV